jgi:hypothetical protein
VTTDVHSNRPAGPPLPPPGAPPPPPPGAALPPPRAPAPPAAAPRRPWRSRLPEAVATVGALLVIAAIAGFLSSTWALLGDYGKSLVLAAAAVGLTIAGMWGERSGRRTFTTIVGLLWLTATAVLTGAASLATLAALPGAGRVAISVAGLVGAAHALLVLQRRPDSPLQQLAVAGAALYAAGPIGTDLADRFAWAQVPDQLGLPLAGLLDPTITSDLFALTGIVHAVIGIAWLALGGTLTGRGATTARVGGTLVLAYAAMELNVLTNPLGAVAALLIVLGYLIAGLANDDGFLVGAGTIGALVCGIRVIWALFTGEVAVTLTVFTVGLLMLGWAYRAARRRPD